ncbi:hypothetical protein Sste5346_003851 [Sporothrix stenoceras]|uniref:Uncharacterized protein n=1 Tax=Sporothrix stenoceras TaxID=5173 RepID=A0ABR3ZCD1_9PEZI
MATVTTSNGDNYDDESVPPLTPSDAAIQRNAFSIFNAVHSATRQWGSSLNHNGMSIFLATVPEGQLLYHGGDEAERAKGVTGEGFDWLAFELEHAQMFGRGRSGGPPPFFTPPGRKPLPSDNVAEAHYNRRSHHRMLAQEHGQKTLGDDEDNENSDDGDDKPKKPEIPDGFDDEAFRGYFHTYRANRPLNLLYIDGMSAGKVDYGCIDTQDMMLLGWPDDGFKFMEETKKEETNKEETKKDKGKKKGGKNGDDDKHKGRPGHVWGGEVNRARDLCAMAKKWAWDEKGDRRIDGFVRTEAGFEIIYCDFSEGGGLDVVNIQASPFQNQTGGLPVFVEAEFLRGVSLRYHGFPSGRIHVDWSSMVSAFFYDVNLTNPDASRPELPRLSNVTKSERRGIRARVRDVVAARGHLAVHERQSIDWQGIVDVIVTRFSQRLDQLARGTTKPITELAGQILPTLLYAYINNTNPDEPHDLQLDRCTQHYLLGALDREKSLTSEDRSIYLALETVTRTICTSLFDIRSVLFKESSHEYADVSEDDISTPETRKEIRVRQLVNDLMGKLQWTTWRQCDPCQHPDELCLVAMFPWGDDEDHFHPKCNTMENIQMRYGYWRLG